MTNVVLHPEIVHSKLWRYEIPHDSERVITNFFMVTQAWVDRADKHSNNLSLKYMSDLVKRVSFKANNEPVCMLYNGKDLTEYEPIDRSFDKNILPFFKSKLELNRLYNSCLEIVIEFTRQPLEDSVLIEMEVDKVDKYMCLSGLSTVHGDILSYFNGRLVQ